jgi:hypothetical protein
MPSGLQIRPMEERAPKPMRSAYGSQVEQFFAPSMRKWYGEEGVDRRVDAMQGLYEEYGSPEFVEIPEDSPRGGSYDPWSKKVNLKRSLGDANITYYPREGGERRATKLEDVALEELAHVAQQKERSPIWEAERFENPNALIHPFSKKGRRAMKSELGQNLLNAVGHLPEGRFRKHLSSKFYNMAGYGDPNTVEYDAHQVRSPVIKDRYFQQLGEMAGGIKG